jgi:hypothetical protein
LRASPPAEPPGPVSSDWDEATRAAVPARLDPPGALRFFTADEEPTLPQAFVHALLLESAVRLAT